MNYLVSIVFLFFSLFFFSRVFRLAAYFFKVTSDYPVLSDRCRVVSVPCVLFLNRRVYLTSVPAFFRVYRRSAAYRLAGCPSMNSLCG